MRIAQLCPIHPISRTRHPALPDLSERHLRICEPLSSLVEFHAYQLTCRERSEGPESCAVKVMREPDKPWQRPQQAL